VALDVSSASKALQLADQVREVASLFKVGKQLFTAVGPEVVRDLQASGRKVFLDLKFHDIPNTVRAAVREAAKLGVNMLTVHAAAGSKVLRAAAEAAAEGANRPLILAVTVLTSFTDADLEETGVSGRVRDHALKMAQLARSVGCGGIVTSAREAGALRHELGPDFVIVTPGIRPAGAEADDQARAATPAEAIRAGATYIVVGRPITGAANPAQEARRIVDEIAAAANTGAGPGSPRRSGLSRLAR